MEGAPKLLKKIPNRNVQRFGFVYLDTNGLNHGPVLDHENLDCTQRQCEISKDIVGKHRTIFDPRISAGETEKLPCSEYLRISSWSYDVEGRAEKCVERWRTRRLNNSTKYQLHALTTIISKKKKQNLLENCHISALKLF